MILTPAVAKSNQVGVAPFLHAAVRPEGSRAVVNAPHHGQLRRHRRFQFKSEVIEQVRVILAVGALVITDCRVVADAFDEAKAEPWLNP